MDEVNKAAEIIKNGGIVIFPTDTAFGIGCRIDDEDAVKRLFTLRKRPETKAVPVLVSDLHMAQKYLQSVPKNVIDNLIKPFWPGALTIILKCKKNSIPALVRGGGETVGIRVPSHLTTLALINGAGVPVIGTSANFAGEHTPYTFEDLDIELVKKVDFVVPGECHIREASTVIDCTVNPWRVLRQGAVII